MRPNPCAHERQRGTNLGQRYVPRQTAPGLLVPTAVALAVRAILHRNEAELDQAAVGLLDLRERETSASCCIEADGHTIGRLPSS